MGLWPEKLVLFFTHPLPVHTFIGSYFLISHLRIFLYRSSLTGQQPFGAEALI
jgi:hypothetical protein